MAHARMALEAHRAEREGGSVRLGGEVAGEVTSLLRRARAGDASADAELHERIGADLRRIAASALRGQAAGHSLQPTALVNEAYLRLARYEAPDWQCRAHYFAVAAKVMRHVLVDHARRKARAKRGGTAADLPLDGVTVAVGEMEPELLDLADALERLESAHPDAGKLVELRFFGGLTMEEVARELGLSISTAERRWALARAWLYRELS